MHLADTRNVGTTGPEAPQVQRLAQQLFAVSEWLLLMVNRRTFGSFASVPLTVPQSSQLVGLYFQPWCRLL